MTLLACILIPTSALAIYLWGHMLGYAKGLADGAEEVASAVDERLNGRWGE